MTRDKIKYEETLKVIKTLTLFDDDLMTLVFDKNISATELLLNIILKRDDLKVIEVVAQREYKNPMAGGRSITIDIYALDGEEKVYDIEVQCASTGADAHRARFHSSMIDTKMLKAKQSFKELHDSYVIFITKTDVVGYGLPMYHIERKCEETGEAFGDGSHIIYVNGVYGKDDPVGKLMHDFRCKNPDEMFYKELAEQVAYFKESEGGRKEMCEAVESLAHKWAKEMAQGMAESMAQGMAESMAQGMAESMAQKMAEEIADEKIKKEKHMVAMKMLKAGKYALGEISEMVGLPYAEIQILQQNI